MLNRPSITPLARGCTRRHSAVWMVALVLLSGCGADVASAGVSAAKLQVMQNQQAQAQAAQFKKALDEAMQATHAAASAADQQ